MMMTTGTAFSSSIHITIVVVVVAYGQAKKFYKVYFIVGEIIILYLNFLLLDVDERLRANLKLIEAKNSREVE